jgi:cytochrome c oxidase subunit 2
MTRSPRRRWLARVGLLVVAVMSLSACGQELSTLKPKGPTARDVDHLIDPVFIVAGLVLLLIFAVTLITIVKFRATKHDDDFPVQLHGNTKLEIGWTIVPALILAGVAVFSVAGYLKQNHYHRDRAMSVVVVGQQWWWEYRYYFDGFNPDKDWDPDIDPAINAVNKHDGKTEKHANIVTATQLVIPANTEIDLTITSRDVIHSFWIPQLNGKRDAVPSRMAPWKVQADNPGVYFGQCTEFCG